MPLQQHRQAIGGAIGALGANGREGDSPLVENLDTGFLNW